MAFDNTKLYILSNGFGADSGRRIFSYDDPQTTIAAAKVSGYFANAVPAFRVDDLVYIAASDDREFTYVSAISPAVTVADLVTASSGAVPDGSITNAKLADGAVSGAKIAPLGIPAGSYAAGSIDTADLQDHAVGSSKIANGAVALEDLSTAVSNLLVSHAIEHTTTGGSATEAVTLAGVTAGDVCVVTMHTAPAQGETILTAACATGAVDIVFSGDPSTTHVVNIIVFKNTVAPPPIS